MKPQPFGHTFTAGAIGFCIGAGVSQTAGFDPGAGLGLAVIVAVICACFSEEPL